MTGIPIVRRWRLTSFAAIGAIGFAVDATLLLIGFHWLKLGHLYARALSFSTAVVVTWYLNRAFTFSDAKDAKAGWEYARYLLVQSGGSAINLMVYWALIEHSSLCARFLLIPLGAGAAVALVFNFWGSRAWVFRGSARQSEAFARTGRAT